MKKICSVFLALMLCLGLCSALFALPANAETRYVYDAADLLRESEEADLEQTAGKISRKTGCDVYVVTVEDFRAVGCYSIENFTETFFNEYSKNNDAVILAISMAERDFCITAHGSLGNEAFTDYGKDILEERIIGKLSDGDYYAAFDRFLSECSDFLDQALNGTPVDVPEREPVSILTCLIIGLIPGSIVSLIIVSGMKASMKTARIAKSADLYAVTDNVHLRSNSDVYTHSTTNVVRIEQNRSSGGGRSGGTSVNSGGFSHHSGKF